MHTCRTDGLLRHRMYKHIWLILRYVTECTHVWLILCNVTYAHIFLTDTLLCHRMCTQIWLILCNVSYVHRCLADTSLCHRMSHYCRHAFTHATCMLWISIHYHKLLASVYTFIAQVPLNAHAFNVAYKCRRNCEKTGQMTWSCAGIITC